ncbi:hypothetical protein GINT2_001494 [Glugoides intestinalis]
MIAEKFIHRGDLVNEINRLGALYDIKEDAIDTPTTFMLCCNNRTERCDARILGIFSQRDRVFRITRLDCIHNCSKTNKREFALQNEIKKKRKEIRTGKIVEFLYPKFKTGYFEVFKAIQRIKQGVCYDNLPVSTFLGGEEVENLENCARKDSSVALRIEDIKADCLHALIDEFTALNPHMKCGLSKGNFFFKHMQMSQVLRPVSEIKVYPRQGGTVVLGLLIDPNGDYIIQSCLISEEPKLKAIEAFLQYDQQFSCSEYTQAFIIDFDVELIDFLTSKKISFFIKSRALFHYLQDPKEEITADYYTQINYGTEEFLELNKEYYLRRFCPFEMFNLNNAHYPDFEYITSHVLSQSFIDCIVSLIWLVSDDIKSRKNLNLEDYESGFPDHLVGYFDELNDIESVRDCTVSLSEGTCECGKFQEFLFPCIHAYKEIKRLGSDPLLYTSNVYNKENLHKIQEIIPIVNIRVHPFKLRQGIKKKKGDFDSSE